MKKIFTLVFAIVLSAIAGAQSPEKFSYQAVIRDAANSLVVNQNVGMQISILQGNISGVSVYTETHTKATNPNGLVSLEIGTGISTDDFSAIDWTNGPYFIKTETDPTGGDSYTIEGTSQLMSVPFALYAKTAERATIDAVDDADADATNELQQLSLNGDTIFISKGNYLVIPGLSYVNELIPPSVQERLDDGESPYDIYNSDNSLIDSLYGKSYQGGLIAYLNTTDGTGIIAASSDQSANVLWGCSGTAITGAEGVAIGTGFQNTSDIVSGCNEDNRAAYICANLSLEGYDDWFLPSKDELNALYTNLHLNGSGDFSVYYWTSTELGNNDAYVQRFDNGNQYNGGKYDDRYFYVRAVRAVRAF